MVPTQRAISKFGRQHPAEAHQLPRMLASPSGGPAGQPRSTPASRPSSARNCPTRAVKGLQKLARSCSGRQGPQRLGKSAPLPRCAAAIRQVTNAPEASRSIQRLQRLHPQAALDAPGPPDRAHKACRSLLALPDLLTTLSWAELRVALVSLDELDELGEVAEVAEASEASEPSELSEPSEPSEPSEASEDAEESEDPEVPEAPEAPEAWL